MADKTKKSVRGLNKPLNIHWSLVIQSLKKRMMKQSPMVWNHHQVAGKKNYIQILNQLWLDKNKIAK